HRSKALFVYAIPWIDDLVLRITRESSLDRQPYNAYNTHKIYYKPFEGLDLKPAQRADLSGEGEG
ncbi:MAG TPA: hypothetical protein PLI60_08935, partial [Anaerolineaceae bacterium]|nr:hypothetical protein [Anaerolineaceae bacterium]